MHIRKLIMNYQEVWGGSDQCHDVFGGFVHNILRAIQSDQKRPKLMWIEEERRSQEGMGQGFLQETQAPCLPGTFPLWS